jgi:hypothetical protein
MSGFSHAVSRALMSGFSHAVSRAQMSGDPLIRCQGLPLCCCT